MEPQGLVVGYVSPAFAVLFEDFGIEAPGYDGLDDCVVVVGARVMWWEGDEVSLAGVVVAPVAAGSRHASQDLQAGQYRARARSST